ncbi:hypothetical protein D3C87_1666770 [compost metagenome]
MGDAVGEETILLAHDFRSHLENGLGPLVEALGEPVGGGQAIGEEGLLGRIARLLGDGRIVDAVDQNARQGFGIEFDLPGAIRTAADEDIGHHRFDRTAVESQTGLGIELADFGQHIDQVLAVAAHGLRQAGHVVLGQHADIVEQSQHHRIEAIAVP